MYIVDDVFGIILKVGMYDIYHASYIWDVVLPYNQEGVITSVNTIDVKMKNLQLAIGIITHFYSCPFTIKFTFMNNWG